MAGNLIQYSLAFATVNGLLLAQEQDVSVDRDTNGVPVSTVVNGYSGDSPGAGMVDITVESAVPAANFEFNAGPLMVSLTPAKVFILGPGGKQLKCTVQIYKDQFGHGVNKASKYTFKCRAALVDWQ